MSCPNSLTMLVVDDDSDYCAFVEHIAQRHGIDTHVAHTIRAGTQLAADDRLTFDAFIIDGYLPDGVGLDLIHHLRKTRGPDVPIAFISAAFSDAYSFRELKVEHAIDYVLQKPVVERDMIELLSTFRNRHQPVRAQDETADIMRELKAVYQTTIFDKLEEFERLVISIRTDYRPETLANFRRHVHKIAGSAGSYGYPRVSVLCKAMEKTVTERLESGLQSDANFTRTLTRFLRQIRIASQFESPANADESFVSGCRTLSGDEHQLLDLMLIAPDDSLLEAVRKHADEQGINFIGEADPQAAKLLLANAEFCPKLLLIALMPGQAIDAYDLIRDFRHTRPTLCARIGVIAPPSHSVPASKAHYYGIDLIIPEPISTNAIIDLALAQPEDAPAGTFSVLLVDNDLALHTTVSQLLDDIGVAVRCVRSGRELLPALEEEHPHLLLLDMGLEDVDGHEMLRVLRADPRFTELAIAILTTRSADTDIETAYLAGADAFITKPIIRRLFQAQVLSFQRRHTLQEQARSRDHLTGLLNRQAFVRRLHETITTSDAEHDEISLVLLDMDDFRNINTTQSYAIGDRILSRFGHRLSRSFRSDDYVSRSGSDEFMLMLRTSVIQAQFIIGGLLEETRLQTLIPQYQHVRMTFSAGIAGVPTHANTAADMHTAALKALCTAKTTGKDRVVVANSTKTIWIIDDDIDLQTLLAHALMTRGCDTLSASHHAELVSLLDQHAGTAPDLVLLGDDLGTMPVTEIVALLDDTIPLHIPFLILSATPDQPVIQTRRHARQAKPFSVPALMEVIQTLLQ